LSHLHSLPTRRSSDLKVLDRPVTDATTCIKNKVFQYVISILRMAYFWMELYSITLFVWMTHCCDWCLRACCIYLEISWCSFYFIPVAHPNRLFFRSVCE